MAVLGQTLLQVVIDTKMICSILGQTVSRTALSEAKTATTCCSGVARSSSHQSGLPLHPSAPFLLEKAVCARANSPVVAGVVYLDPRNTDTLKPTEVGSDEGLFQLGMAGEYKVAGGKAEIHARITSRQTEYQRV